MKRTCRRNNFIGDGTKIERKSVEKGAQKDYKYSELTGKIIGCAMEVHRILGNGFQEVIYHRALAKEMSLQNLSFIREKEMPIFYKGEQLGTRRVDFLVEETISVEIKATIKLEDVHLTQAINLFKTKKQGFQPCFFVFSDDDQYSSSLKKKSSLLG